jgi:hypothetical protein
VSDRFAVPLSNADGTPYTGATAPSVVDFRDLGGTARPVNPAITHSGDGLWKGAVTDADVQTGSVLLLQAPANVYPGVLRSGRSASSRTRSAWRSSSTQPPGALWAGAAPSVIAGRSALRRHACRPSCCRW